MKFYIEKEGEMIQVMSIKQASNEIHYAQRTIRDWCDFGQIKYIKYAGILFPLASEIHRIRRDKLGHNLIP